VERELDVGRLEGLSVVAFESRRAAETEHLLARHGARVVSAPALREVPIEDNPAALRFLEELEKGRIDALILLTGVGTRALVEAVAKRCPRGRFAELLGGIPLVARGPKPVAALRELGLTPRVRAPEPNTWRELLEALDRELPVRSLRVAMQEYGRTNPDLLAGLQERGARVLQVPVYRWALPHDLRPLEGAIERILDHDADVVVFTTAVQVDHLLEVAGDAANDVVQALDEGAVVASIGPSASEALREHGIRPEIEPEHPKLGYLVGAIAEQAPVLLARKRAKH